MIIRKVYANAVRSREDRTLKREKERERERERERHAVSKGQITSN